MKKNFEPSVFIFFDGACAPINPCGHMGIGCYIEEDNKRIFEYSGYVPESFDNSNNLAEYMALENALDFILENGMQNEKIQVYGDSMLVIKQMNNRWRIKGGRYYESAIRCKEKVENIKNIQFTWIPREQNFLADELSNKELIKNNIKLFKK